MAAPSSDKVLIGAALLLAVASAGVFGMLALRHIGAPTGPLPQVQLADTPYTPIAPDAPPVKTETWATPTAQTRGRDWIYDAFTPPEIFYNARSKQFTVKPPSSLQEEESEAFGLDLIAVRPEPFRLQLIGFAGSGATAKGVFQNVKSSKTDVATAGKRFQELGLTVKTFEVSLQTIQRTGSMPTKQLVATAVVHDEKANRDVMLTNRERVFTGTLFAFVAATGATAEREVREGDSFKLGEVTYRIEKVSLTPQTVEVTKESPTLTQPDRQVLKPREAEDAERPDGTPGP